MACKVLLDNLSAFGLVWGVALVGSLIAQGIMWAVRRR